MTEKSDPVLVDIDEPTKVEIVKIVESLIGVAALRNTPRRTDSWKGECAARFLLSWLSAREYGGFDIFSLGALGKGVGSDMMRVLDFISRTGAHPADLGMAQQIRDLAARPLRKKKNAA